MEVTARAGRYGCVAGARGCLAAVVDGRGWGGVCGPGGGMVAAEDKGALNKQYRLVTPNGPVLSDIPGRYAGWCSGKIFGRLDCQSGKQLKHENRVFFGSWEDAIACGYRPCKVCKPTDGDQIEHQACSAR